MSKPHTAPARSEGTFVHAQVAWGLALAAMLGSLFFSEVMRLPPCNLCWYQRICLYPLVVLLPVGIVRRDPGLILYTAPLVGIGLLLAAYHNLLYYGVISEDLAPCTQGVPCTTRQIEWFGFVGIPLLGLGAFVSIAAALLLHHKKVRLSARGIG